MMMIKELTSAPGALSVCPASVIRDSGSCQTIAATSELPASSSILSGGAINRRSLMNMVVSTAAFAATAIPVIAGNPDATIIAAAERLHELKPMYDAAQARWDETYAEFRTRRPERPRELKWRAPDGLNVGHWGGKERGGPWL